MFALAWSYAKKRPEMAKRLELWVAYQRYLVYELNNRDKEWQGLKRFPKAHENQYEIEEENICEMIIFLMVEKYW